MGLDADPAVVRADLTQLQQVILNLAINARDAMPDGGRLAVETADGGMDAEGRDWMVLSVSDTGIGMTEEVRLRAFEPFFTTKEPGKGTGLGLSTAHGIILQSGGTIELASITGKGTRFVIRLPRLHDADGDASAPEAATTPIKFSPGSGLLTRIPVMEIVAAGGGFRDFRPAWPK